MEMGPVGIGIEEVALTMPVPRISIPRDDIRPVMFSSQYYATCPECGLNFIRRSTTRVYCSSRCCFRVRDRLYRYCLRHNLLPPRGPDGKRPRISLRQRAYICSRYFDSLTARQRRLALSRRNNPGNPILRGVGKTILLSGVVGRSMIPARGQRHAATAIS